MDILSQYGRLDIGSAQKNGVTKVMPFESTGFPGFPKYVVRQVLSWKKALRFINALFALRIQA